MFKYLAAFLLFASSAFAQTDSGLIPNNTVLGNTSGIRGAPRPIPMPSSGVTSLGGGTGALTLGQGLARSGQQIFSTAPYFNVTEYGAVCDGTTDDYSAINAAVLAVQAAGGGTVVFPGRVCVINQMLAISGSPNGYTKISLQGQGQYSSYLVGKGASFTGACVVQFGGQGLVDGMSFNNGSMAGVSGASMHGVCNNRPFGGGGIDHLVIQNSLFVGFGLANNACIYNTGGQQATTSVFNSTFNGCWHGIKVDTWDVGAVIQGNHMFNVVNGILLDGTANAVEGVNILNNEILAGNPRTGAYNFRPLDIINACYDCHVAFNVFDAEPIGVGNYCEGSGNLSRAVRIQNSATTSFVTNWMAKGFLASGSYHIGLRLTGNTFPDGCNAFIQNTTGFTANSNVAYAGSSDGQWLSVVNSQTFSVTGNVAWGPRGGIAVGGTVSKCTFGNNVVSGSSAMGTPCTSTGNVGP